VMALGEADIFEVVVFAAGAHAFLCCGGFVVVALLEAEENVFELIHPGVGEEEGGVAMGDERGTADAAVAFALEEAEEHFADLVPAHFLGVMRRHGFADILTVQRWLRWRRW
jgi:hypothetical protein